jgi:hypothetical protein
VPVRCPECPLPGIVTSVVPSMSIPARTRESLSMAAMALAPPTEWPAIAMRDGSISQAPFHAGRDPVSWSSTKETSAARPFTSFSHHAGVLSISQVTHVVTRPSGNVVATFS